MAGLLCALGPQPGWAEALVDRLSPALRHYPWLSTRTFSVGPFALALVLHRDVEPPLWCVAQAGLSLVIFGEYIHDERRDTPPEDIARDLADHVRHERWDQVRNRNGLYNLVGWDNDIGRLIIANDATGALLLFRARHAQGWIWCTEPGVLPHSDASADIDTAALRSLLCIGYQADHRTLHHDIDVLPPATTQVITLRQGALAQATHSALPQTTPCAACFEQTYMTLLHDAVRIRLRHTRQVQLPLSGGLDSRLLLGVSLALNQVVVPFTLDGAGQTRDATVAVDIAQRAGLGCRVEQAQVGVTRDLPSHVPLLKTALATTADWHPALSFPVCGALTPGEPILLGFLGGTLSGAFVHPASAEHGLTALRASALAPFWGPISAGSPANVLVPAWGQLPGGDDAIPAPPELLTNLYGRQRRYTSYLVRLAWNFGRPICPFADARLLQLALSAPRQVLAHQHTRLDLFGRTFPQLAALPSANDGLPFDASRRRRLRGWLRRAGLGRHVRRIAPNASPRYDYGRFTTLALQCVDMVTPAYKRRLPERLSPMAMLAIAPILLLESENTIRIALDFIDDLNTKHIERAGGG